jgi:hypothetical protein
MSTDAELLRSHLNLALKSLPQAQIRDFGGYAVGKRRKPNVIYPMSEKVAKHLFEYMIIKTPNEESTSRESLSGAVAAALQNVSDEMAHRLTSRDFRTWEQLCEAIAASLEGCMVFTQKPYDGSLTARADYNGWKSHEMICAGERPKGKWQHSWPGKIGDDFVGYLGNRCMGRIFKIDLPEYNSRWFWLLSLEGAERLNWPIAGYEASANGAACRLERIYFAIEAGESRTGQ